MAQDTKPETPTEGGRVFREFPVGRLEGESAVGPAGYQNANAIRKQVENVVDADAFGKLADAGISAFGFELEVSTTANHLLPPFMDLSGAIGLSMIWITKVESVPAHGPHMYIFARQGENGPEPLGDEPTSGKTAGCFFAAHFATEEPLTPKQWEKAFGNIGVDAGGGRGLLSGEVTLHPTSDAALVWKKNDVLWRAFVVDLLINGTSGNIAVEQTSYEHYEWLLGQLGFVSTTGGASWEPPEHSFWQKGSLRIPEWGGGSAGGGGGTAEEVTFPSGATLPVVGGADARDDNQWPLSEQHWDPNYSGNPLLDTSGDHREKQLSEHFTVGEYAQSGNTEFTRARIDPAFVRYLEQLREHVNDEQAAADEEYSLRIGSGYRHWEYNREGDTYDWPDDESTIDSMEPGPHSVDTDGDGDTEDYEWKLTLSDQSDPVYKDLTRSEHCSGRGADIDFASTTYQVIDNDKAYLRDPDADPAYDTFTQDIVNVSAYSNWYGDSPPGSVTQHTDTDIWKITKGTEVEETGDSATNPDGDSVVKVQDRSGNVLGWTNEANLSPDRNPGFDQVELAKMALHALVDENYNDISPEGVNPCDPRTGVGGQWNNFHVDIKPYPWIGDAGDAWAYSDAPEDAKADANEHHNDFRGLSPDDEQPAEYFENCPTAPAEAGTEVEGGIYGVDSRAAWLREPKPDTPDEDLQPATDESNPLRSFWEDSVDVHYAESDDDDVDGYWELSWGIYVQYKEARNGPDGSKIAKVATPGDQLIGWTSFSNLVYTGTSV
ncbi:hypothetical protein [Haloarcula halophila]|uniref:hypothetical protein n=1 Tax=Haloarcula TaxID=2237 RepID=UPI0023E41C7B|nr:hypothetical protein [Halomicroarcula sp. DFY41]